MTDEEIQLQLLIQAADSGLLAFQPHEDPLLHDLIEKGYLSEEPDRDPTYSLLTLTPKGHSLISSLRASRP